MKYLLLVAGMLLGNTFLSVAYADDKSVSLIHINHAYVNSVPPVVKVTAGFFEMTNRGGTTVTLTGISSSASCASQL